MQLMASQTAKQHSDLRRPPLWSLVNMAKPKSMILMMPPAQTMCKPCKFHEIGRQNCDQSAFLL
jgi:hypothetical protein